MIVIQQLVLGPQCNLLEHIEKHLNCGPWLDQSSYVIVNILDSNSIPVWPSS